ncbi:MAG: SWIM zinc finger family protein [Pirellulales bacterium]|nr:SWIM zinc finger family protein [Pirellulales bacterium]
MNPDSPTASDELVYSYRFASVVERDRVRLAASVTAPEKTAADGTFFNGRLAHPRETAALLLALSHIVRTHFFDARPPQMDPIVTTSRTLMRWEGFSGCCGAYARLDLDDAALRTDVRGFGTTNVDFNPKMLSHLGGIGRQDDVGLSVSTDAVEVRSGSRKVKEKKVTLPRRWLKGLCEVQVYQSRLTLRHRFSPGAIVSLLQSASRATGGVQYLAVAGGKPRLTLRPSAGTVAIGGASRLSALRPLLPLAREVSLYEDEESGVHAWLAELPWARFWLVLSPTLQRGFSGEGQVLGSLARGRWEDDFDAVQDLLAGPPGASPAETIDPAEIAARLGIPSSDARDALDALATSGLAGFDAHRGYYFQRPLPFELARLEKDQPRLRSAKKLFEAGQTRVVRREGDATFDVEVTSGDVTYFVRLRPEGDRCSCPWFSRHQGQRGPCKHVLAARMAVAPPPTDS